MFPGPGRLARRSGRLLRIVVASARAISGVLTGRGNHWTGGRLPPAVAIFQALLRQAAGSPFQAGGRGRYLSVMAWEASQRPWMLQKAAAVRVPGAVVFMAKVTPWKVCTGPVLGPSTASPWAQNSKLPTS